MEIHDATHGCPGLSYLNTCERAMPNLNCAQSSLALCMSPDRPQFLQEIMSGVPSMKAACKAIADYDDIKEVAIAALKRQLARN
eukprot:8482337-Ditylum_brightwellii.AAC.1